MEKSPQAKTCVLAIISLVLGLLFFIPTGLAALVLGIIALVRISKHKEELEGKGLAIAGTIIGGIRIIILPFVIIGLINVGLIFPGVSTAREEALQLETASNMRQIGIAFAREEALQLETASNMRQIGLALYAHAKNNGGDLPANLDELVTEDYLADDEIFENAFGGAMEMDSAAAGGCLWGMNATDVLVTDNESTTGKSTGYKLNADGSVDMGK